MSTTSHYIETVGRRKTAIARVRLTPSKSASLTVNETPVAEYFKTEALQKVATEALALAPEGVFTITAKIGGGGISSQAEALRHGIARALTKKEEALRSPLKKAGFLKRDPRKIERKKFGLKKARKAPQWSKR